MFKIFLLKKKKKKKDSFVSIVVFQSPKVFLSFSSPHIQLHSLLFYFGDFFGDLEGLLLDDLLLEALLFLFGDLERDEE